MDNGRWRSARRSTPVAHEGEWPYSFVWVTSSTLVYCYRYTNVAFINSLTSGTQWIACQGAFVQDSLHSKSSTTASAIGSWAQSQVCWLVPSCFLDVSRFIFWGHNFSVRVRRDASEGCLPQCVHSDISSDIVESGFTVWSAISYHGWSNSLRIKGSLNSNGCVREVLQPEIVSFQQGIPGAIFQHDNERPHVVKTIGNFCSVQHWRFLPWPAYSPDMSPIEHVWHLVGRRLARDLRPAALNTNFCCACKQCGSPFPKQYIQYLLDFMPRRIAALIVARAGYTKFEHCFFLISSFISTNTRRLSIKFHVILVISTWCCISYKQQYM